MNILAIFVCCIINILIGSLWYSKYMFYDSWAKYAHIKTKTTQSKLQTNISYISGFVSNFIMVMCLSLFISYLNISSVSKAILLALLIWTGFFATTQFGSVLWEQKNIRYYLINTSYFLVTITTSSIILVLWL